MRIEVVRVGVLISSILLQCMFGCDSAAVPAKGGTSGTLKFGADVSSDIVVTVHQSTGGQFTPVGFGTTIHDGSFILYKAGASEPLWLEPSDYVFTLESIGPPVRFPKEYLSPKTTPLKVTWTAEMKSVDLEAPQKLIAQ